MNAPAPGILRLLALFVLLFGAAFEVGHIHHHIAHAGHDHHVGDPEHLDCLVFHSGVVVEDTVSPDPGFTPVGATPADEAVRASDAHPFRIHDSRAPPASS